MGYTLCILGCGTMGIAVLSGVIDSLDTLSKFRDDFPKWESHTPGTLTPVQSPDGHSDNSIPSKFLACVSREDTARKLKMVFGNLGELGSAVEIFASNNLKPVQNADVVLLCCKPQVAHAILAEPGIKEALDGKLLISILAGITMNQLVSWVLPTTRVVRAMPNTPCKIREGMTVVSNLPPSEYQETDRAIILKIFSSIGRCRFLEEKHFDACTALSGSGPAFACIFMEAMADGGVMMGLPRAEALELAAQTLQGAARMVLQGGAHPAQIKDSVTTPGGCTIAGLLALEDGKVRSTIARCIQIATERASELGQPTQNTSLHFLQLDIDRSYSIIFAKTLRCSRAHVNLRSRPTNFLRSVSNLNATILAVNNRQTSATLSNQTIITIVWSSRYCEMGQALHLTSNTTFVIVVLAFSMVILAGALSYTFFRGRKRDASNDTIIAFNHHRKSHLILLVDDESPPSSLRYNSLSAQGRFSISESESFTSIKISPSCPTVFGHEIDGEVILRVVLTPPTPAKRERRESLIDYDESSEDLPAYYI